MQENVHSVQHSEIFETSFLIVNTSERVAIKPNMKDGQIIITANKRDHKSRKSNSKSVIKQDLIATTHKLIDQMLDTVFNDSELFPMSDDRNESTIGDDFFHTIILRETPRDPHLSRLPSPTDLRVSQLIANERMVEPRTDDCNCLTHIDGRGPCCSRVFRRPHKMGVILSKQLLRERGGQYLRWLTDKFRLSAPIQGNDYRDVVLVRDFYAAVVSGYMYHKAGYECWLSPYGKPIKSSMINTYWANVPEDLPISPRKNRSICSYLAEVSLAEGLLLWTDVSFRWWLDPLVQQWKYAQTKDDEGRTLFVCYQDLVMGSSKIQSTMQSILDHFFPGGHDFRAPKHLIKDAGDHATNGTRSDILKELVRIDETHYNGRIGKMFLAFGCPPEHRDRW